MKTKVNDPAQSAVGLSLKKLITPILSSIDSFNYLLKSHHRRTTIICYHLGRELNLNEKDFFDLILAASLHDIGAVTVQEKLQLFEQDLVAPNIHCARGFSLLSAFPPFVEIAHIIRNHHITYNEYLKKPAAVAFQSHILHLADRVEITTHNYEHDLQKLAPMTLKKISEDKARFHPDVLSALSHIVQLPSLWEDLEHLTFDDLFERIPYFDIVNLSIEDVETLTFILSKIIDLRSHFTANHSLTVAYLAERIGKYFGIDEINRKKLKIAGYLHDIGKIAIDPRLIEKKGPLTADEFTVVRKHVEYTSTILNPLRNYEFFRNIVSWAENHHEKADGSGYWQGLRDDEFDIESKIIAYSDIISALSETRPYRKSLPLDETFDVINREIASDISRDMFQVIDGHREDLRIFIESTLINF